MPVVVLEIVFVVLWSTGFVGAQFGLQHTGAFTLLFWRYLLAALLLGSWLLLRGAWRGGSWPAVRQALIVGVLAHAVWLAPLYQAQEYGVSPGLTALLAALQPLLAGVLAGPLLHEPVSGRQWAGLGIGFLGVVTVVGSHLHLAATPFAHLLPIISIVGLTTAMFYQRKAAQRQTTVTALPPLVSLVLQFWVTAAVLLPPALLTEQLATDWNRELLLTVLWLSTVLSLGCYALLWILVRRTTATQASSLLYFTPPTTLLMSYVLFDTTLSTTDLLGLAIAAVGVVLVRLPAVQGDSGKAARNRSASCAAVSARTCAEV